MKILTMTERIFCPRASFRRIMSIGHISSKCIGVLDRFVLEKDEPKLELSQLRT